MGPWVIELEIDKGICLVDLRGRGYEYVRSNPAWREATVWKIFTSEDDYPSHMKTGKHQR